MQKCSYESILSAVGRVLDEANAQSFSIRDVADGLVVEAALDAEHSPIALKLDLKDLVELVDRPARADQTPDFTRSYGRDESTLNHFLAKHELVGAGR